MDISNIIIIGLFLIQYLRVVKMHLMTPPPPRDGDSSDSSYAIHDQNDDVDFDCFYW